MADFENERNAYKEKVARQCDAINHLLALSRSHSGLLEPGVVRQLELFQEKCNKLYQKLDKNEFEIAIVGLEKAGKSTFGNALMKNRILPDADERCTYTSTCIRYGQDQAVVRFFNSREMDQLLRGYLEELGIENVESYTYQGMSRTDYLALYGRLDSKTRIRYEKTVNQDILNLLDNKSSILSQYVGQPDKTFQGEELNTDEFRDYIVSPKVAVAVKEVCIESSKLSGMTNAVIYDVPGFDSPTSMHLEQTKKRMKEADAIMLIASAEKPSFTAPALDIFNNVVDEDNVSLSDKLFVFGNRADAANTLAKNIETLKAEIDRWNLLNRFLIGDRLIIGSAKAHLQANGLIEGDFCVRKINEDQEYQKAWQHGDGIDYAYQKLVDYNKTERFSVLKRKIRRNNDEIRDLFDDLKSKYANGASAVDYHALYETISAFSSDASAKIVKDLEEIRHEIRVKYSESLSLSKALEDCVKELFANKERYVMSDEDIHNAELKIIHGEGTNVEKVDQIIREEKFERIYGDFARSAFSVAQKDHEIYFNQIIDSFESALHIVKSSPRYEELHEMVIAFVERCKKNREDDFIYQALIERFVRDLVQVVIGRPYSSEARLDEFVKNAEVFSGLVLFYNTGDANDGYKRQFLSVAPKNQPLLLALVFHKYAKAEDETKRLMDHLGSIRDTLCENPEVIQLAFSIVKQDPVAGADAAIKLINKNALKSVKTDDELLRSVVPSLRTVRKELIDKGREDGVDSTRRYDFDFTNAERFKGQYKQFFGNMPVRTYEKLQEFFAKDLEILEKFLIHASIPAIRLEKPFLAREEQSINNLLELVKSREFDKMINKHSEALLPESYQNINMQMENLIANKEAVAEVEKILKTIDGGIE